MSTLSLKSRSSLTPIEDAGVDSSTAPSTMAAIDLDNQRIDDDDDDEFEAGMMNEQGPPSSDDLDKDGDEPGRSHSVLLVRESPSIMNNIDGDTIPDEGNNNDDENDDDGDDDDDDGDDNDDDDDDGNDDDDDNEDDDEEEEGEEDDDDEEEEEFYEYSNSMSDTTDSNNMSRSSDGKSLNDSSCSELSSRQLAFSNKIDVRNRNDLSNIEEEGTALDGHDALLASTTHPRCESKCNNQADDTNLNYVHRNSADTESPTTRNTPIRSQDDDNGPDDNVESNEITSKTFGPADYNVNRDDPVENSYFASFKSSDSRTSTKPASETENTPRNPDDHHASHSQSTNAAFADTSGEMDIIITHSSPEHNTDAVSQVTSESMNGSAKHEETLTEASLAKAAGFSEKQMKQNGDEEQRAVSVETHGMIVEQRIALPKDTNITDTGFSSESTNQLSLDDSKEDGYPDGNKTDVPPVREESGEEERDFNHQDEFLKVEKKNQSASLESSDHTNVRYGDDGLGVGISESSPVRPPNEEHIANDRCSIDDASGGEGPKDIGRSEHGGTESDDRNNSGDSIGEKEVDYTKNTLEVCDNHTENDKGTIDMLDLHESKEDKDDVGKHQEERHAPHTNKQHDEESADDSPIFYVEGDEVPTPHLSGEFDTTKQNSADTAEPQTLLLSKTKGDVSKSVYEHRSGMAKDGDSDESFKEPPEQEINHDALTRDDEDMEKMSVSGRHASDTNGRTSPPTKESGSSASSSSSGSSSESQGEDEVNEKEDDVYITKMIRTSKSSSTLSVKTVSSSSSKLSNSPRRLKGDNKKLELLLKGPYADSHTPLTPRLKTRQKGEKINQKKTRTKEKNSKSKTSPSDKKPGVQRLQVHTTKTKKKVIENSSHPDNTTTEGTNGKRSTNKSNSNPVAGEGGDYLAAKDAPDSNATIVAARNIYHIDEAEVEEQDTPTGSSDGTKLVSDQGSELQGVTNTDKTRLDENISLSQEETPEKEGISNSDKNESAPSSDDGSVRSGSMSKTSPEEIDSTKSLQNAIMMGKKKIIISSPKASEKLSAKEAKNAIPLKTQISNSSTSSESNKQSTAKNGAKKGNSKSNGNTSMKPTTITIIDETSGSPKTNPTAGRIILNNIKMNLKRKSLQKNSTKTSSKTKSSSRSPSPEGMSLSNSGGTSHKEAKQAYKTQSMSSLQVPGQSVTPNSWDPPKEEDSLSMYSRRPSMDSVSRKSVDYRIRNTATVIQPQAEEKPKSVFNNDETFIQNAVPCLPLGLAVVCLFLNTVLPGSGTALSGVSILCCGHSRVPHKDDQVLTTTCVNLAVGLAQLLTVSFMLVGWFWSIGWGIKMVAISVKRRLEIKQQREKDLQTLALSAFGSPKRLNGFGV